MYRAAFANEIARAKHFRLKCGVCGAMSRRRLAAFSTEKKSWLGLHHRAPVRHRAADPRHGDDKVLVEALVDDVVEALAQVAA